MTIVVSKPRRRWPRVVVAVALLLVASWLWLVPPLAASLLTGSLQSAGFRDVHVDAVEVGFGRLHARGLRLGRSGTGDVLIPDTTAEFSLGDLWAGRVASLTLVGPTWTMAAERASSPFDEVLRRAGAAGEQPRTALPELPLQRLTIRAGRIVPSAEHGAPVVAFDATLTAGAAQWEVDGRAAAAGHGVRVTAQLDVSAVCAEGPVTMRLAGEKPLELTGTLGARLIAGERVLDLELRGATPFDVMLAGTSWSGDGAVGLRAHGSLAQPAAATIDVRLDDVRLAATDGVQLAGLTTKLRLAGLPVPASAGPQQVTWRSASYDTLKGGAGEAELELKSGLQLHARLVQRAADDVGTLVFTGLQYASGAASTPAHVAFDRVPLQLWLEMLSGGRITGEGRLSGDVDLVVRWQPQPGVELRGGQLTSEGGRVRFLDDAETKDLIRQHVEQIAATTGHDNVVQERLVGALEDFAYRMLDFRIEPGAGGDGVTLRVHTAGQGRKVPQQIDLAVNLHGFDAAVDTALAIKLGLDRAQRRLDDKIDRPDNPQEPR